jgi:hypothetical protein
MIPRSGVVVGPDLVIAPLGPDVPAGPVERMLEAPELMGIDYAICPEMMLHDPDSVLFTHQIAEFVAAQAAVMQAGPDAIPLMFLARIDLLAVQPALAGGVAIAIPVSLCMGCREAQAAQHQQANYCLHRGGFHGVALVRLIRVLTTAFVDGRLHSGGGVLAACLGR